MKTKKQLIDEINHNAEHALKNRLIVFACISCIYFIVFAAKAGVGIYNNTLILILCFGVYAIFCVILCFFKFFSQKTLFAESVKEKLTEASIQYDRAVNERKILLKKYNIHQPLSEARNAEFHDEKDRVLDEALRKEIHCQEEKDALEKIFHDFNMEEFASTSS